MVYLPEIGVCKPVLLLFLPSPRHSMNDALRDAKHLERFLHVQRISSICAHPCSVLVLYLCFIMPYHALSYHTKFICSLSPLPSPIYVCVLGACRRTIIHPAISLYYPSRCAWAMSPSTLCDVVKGEEVDGGGVGVGRERWGEQG